MSGLNEDLMKQEIAQSGSLPNLIALATKIVEQNNVLIEQSNAKEQMILRLIEQNDEILSELIEQQDDEAGSTFLDMDD